MQDLNRKSLSSRLSGGGGPLSLSMGVMSGAGGGGFVLPTHERDGRDDGTKFRDLVWVPDEEKVGSARRRVRHPSMYNIHIYDALSVVIRVYSMQTKALLSLRFCHSSLYLLSKIAVCEFVCTHSSPHVVYTSHITAARCTALVAYVHKKDAHTYSNAYVERCYCVGLSTVFTGTYLLVAPV